MKRFIWLLLFTFLLWGCNDYRQIEVEHITLNSMRFVNTTTAAINLEADVKNPTKRAVSLENLNAVLFKEGKKFAKFCLTDNFVATPGENIAVPINIEAKVLDHIALISTGLNLKSWNLDNFTVSGKFTVKMDGVPKKRIKFKNKPLKSILGIIK